nr:hypothetical protein [uncultured Holophaga sp.]
MRKPFVRKTTHRGIPLSGSLLGLLLLLPLGACRVPKLLPPDASIELSPENPMVSEGGALKLGSLLKNGAMPPVQWMVLQWDGGSVDADGTYHAPKKSGRYVIRATSVQGAPASASVLVEVVPLPVGGMAGPERLPLSPVEEKASVPEQAGCTFLWSIEGGRLEGDPKAREVRFLPERGRPVTLQCRITNRAGDSLISKTRWEPSRAAKLLIQPEDTVITSGDSFDFGFDISGIPEDALVWRVVEPLGGHIDARGRYTAPDTPGLYHVALGTPDGKIPESMAIVRVLPRPLGDIEIEGVAVPGAQGLRALVPYQQGLSYVWGIEGGTLVGRNDGSSCLFAAGQGPSLMLSCVIRNAAGAEHTIRKRLELQPAQPTSSGLKDAPIQ